MKLTFYGGAGDVTGANYLLEEGNLQLIVDCGLHQGSKYAEDLNYTPFAYEPKLIEFVFITHSHIDHIGRLPKLYRDGFRGTVYATDATADLMAVALPDNMSHILHEAERDGHEPLFEQRDLDGIMKLVRGVDYGEKIPLREGVTATLHDAGHVLGSAIVEIQWHDKKIFFSGDLGNPPTPLLRPTEFVHDANYVVMESAYGDRVHEAREERREKLAQIIQETIARKGTLMIPSFALERTQDLLFELNELRQQNKISSVPIFLDSPLAIKLTGVYEKYFGKNSFDFPGIEFTATPDESKRINDVPAPKIIIAGSGMSQGGRILHHERRYLSDPVSTILFVGYQVDGSLGRRIQRGDQMVTIFGETVAVRCHVETVSGYSAHADQPALMHWVKVANSNGSLKKVFVVQGEEHTAKTLANLIREELDVSALAPQPGEVVEL
ncbi:MAG: MBL fold metallo-hydrolase [Patescibacteria group bacterium]